LEHDRIFYMLIKKLRKNFIIGWIFIGIVTALIVIPPLERALLKEKSFFKNKYNNAFMGPFNHYGYGLAPQYVIEYEFQWKDAWNNKEKNFFAQWKQKIKENFKISTIDMVIKDNEFFIYTDQPIHKILSKNKEIEWVKKKDHYIIKPTSTLKNQWKKEIFQRVKDFLMKKYANKSCQVEVINDGLLKVFLFSKKEIKDINLKKSPIKAYGLITSDKEVDQKKTIMIGDGSPFPVYKNIIFDRFMINGIQWMDHDNSNLLKLSLNKEALNNIDNLKKLSIDTIIITADPINFIQKDFGNGFKPINTESQSLLGVLRVQKGGGINNFIVQTLWDDTSKIILDQYFQNYSFEGHLTQKNISCYPSFFHGKQMQILWIMIFLLIMMLAVALFLIFRKYGIISLVDMTLSAMFLGFLIRFFDMVLDLKVIILYVLANIFFFLINFWRNNKIFKQNIDLTSDTNFMIRKQLYQYIHKTINFYNISIATFMTVLFFLIPAFHQGIMVILMACAVIFFQQNFLWNNWIGYFTVKELKHKK